MSDGNGRSVFKMGVKVLNIDKINLNESSRYISFAFYIPKHASSTSFIGKQERSPNSWHGFMETSSADYRLTETTGADQGLMETIGISHSLTLHYENYWYYSWPYRTFCASQDLMETATWNKALRKSLMEAKAFWKLGANQGLLAWGLMNRC